MNNLLARIPVDQIEQAIFSIRGERVMLDFDLAALYQVITTALNQAVRRNRERSSEDSMFQLTPRVRGTEPLTNCDQFAEPSGPEMNLSEVQGRQGEMLKQCHKLFHSQTSLANDRAEGAAIEFLVVWNGGLRGRRFAHQNDVAALRLKTSKPNLAERFNTLRARNHGQLAHAATSTNSTRSSGTGSPRSRKASSCNKIASRTLARASSRVWPWLMHPGRLGTSATMKPSSPGYNRTLLFMISIVADY